MPQNYLNQSEVVKVIGGLTYFSSGSTAMTPTSSNASTAAQLDINISSSLPTNIINNTTLNPYIRFTVVSGSNRSNGIDQEIIIRFFSSSHIQPKYASSADTTNPGYVLIPSRSLYITSSNTEEVTIIDVPYTNPTSYSNLATLLHNTLTGSSYFINNDLSASKTSITEQNEIISIHYNRYKGTVGSYGSTPTLYTGSGGIPFTSGMSVTYTSTGSGALNFTPIENIHFASASYNFRLNTENQGDLELTQGISSSGFTSNSKTDPTLMYFSSSGHVGIGTKTPKADLEVTGSIQADKIITKAKEGRPIVISDSEIKFYETTQIDPEHGDFAVDKEKARIKAVPGSFNLVFEVSGSSGYTNSVYISQSGKIGFNTDDPQTGFDAVVEEAQFQQPGSRKGLKINNEGNIESFNRDVNSATTGSEFILKYSRGTTINAASMNVLLGSDAFGEDQDAVDYFNNLPPEEQSSILEELESVGFISPVQTGDTLGSIRWIAESGSLTSLDPRSTGETAVLKAVVSDVDASGVQADLIFSVAGKTGAAAQVMLLDAGGNHEMTGSLDILGNLTVNQGIYHRGDTDTSIGFSNNNVHIKAGNEINFNVVPSQVTIGDGGNVDLQVKALGDQYNLFSDGGNAKVGIGTNSPGEKLEVVGNISASGALIANTITGTINGGSF